MRARNALRLALAAFGGYAAYAWFAQRRFETLDVETAGAPGAFVDIDGMRVHYVEAGKGDPVVLVHGWNASTFSFRHTIPELARHHRVVAVDLLGFGFSGRPAKGDYSVVAQVRLLAGLLDHLDIRRATVIGHSMGGGIAMHLALAHPERVARLVLVDAASEDEARRGLRAGRLLRHVLFLLSPLALHAEPLGRSVFRLAVHDPAMLTPEVLEGYTRPLRVRGHLRGLGRQMRDRGREPVLDPGRITQPTLVLWGEHDRVIPLSTGEDLSRRIPGARFELVRGAGHLPLEEQPETCNRILAEFLHTAAAAGAPTAGSAVQLEQPA